MKAPFKTIFELLLSYHSASFKKSEIKEPNKSDDTQRSSHFKKEMTSRSKRERSNCDLQIDDTNEGELYEDTDKRVATEKKKSKEKFEYNLKTKSFNEPVKKQCPLPIEDPKKSIEPPEVNTPSFFMSPTASTSSIDPNVNLEEKLQKTKLEAKRNLLNNPNLFDSKIVTGQTKVSSKYSQSVDPEDFTSTSIDYEAAKVD